MASLKFYLDKQLKTRATRTVYLRYKTTQGSITFYPTPVVEATEAKWDQKAQRIKGTSLEAQKLNGRLTEFRKLVHDEVELLRTQSGDSLDPLPAELRAALPQLAGKPGVGITEGSAPLRTAGQPRGTSTSTNDEQSVLTMRLPELVRYVTDLRQAELGIDTCVQYEQVARSLLRFRPLTDNGWLLRKLTPLRLEEWRQWLVREAPEGEDVSNTTANNRCKLLHAVLEYVRQQGQQYRQLLNEDHLNVLARRFKKKDHQRESLSALEMLEFYRTPLPDKTTVSEVLLRDMYCLGWCTSLRQGDLFALERAHLVWGTTPVGKAVPVALDTTSIKTVKASLLPLNDMAADIVLRWLDRERPEIHIDSRWGRHLARYDWPENRVFPFISGRRRAVLRRLWKRLNLFSELVETVRLSGGRQIRQLVPRYRLLSMHTARHGFGNYMAASNVPIEDTSLLMGHASIKTTGIYYHRPEEQALNRARAALAQLPAGPLSDATNTTSPEAPPTAD